MLSPTWLISLALPGSDLPAMYFLPANAILSFENGAYAQLRKNFINNKTENIITTGKTTLFTTGGSTEFIWHTKSSK